MPNPLIHSKRSRPKVLVSVFNKAGVDDATVLLAEKMVSQTYEEAGLSIIWKNCLAQPELERERCIETVDNRHFVLSIEHQARTLETDIYGVAFLAPVPRGPAPLHIDARRS